MANLAKETLEQLKITEPVTALVTSATTLSKGATSIAAAEAVVGGTDMVAAGTMKPAPGTLTTTTIGLLTQSKEDNMTERLKATNDQVSKNIIYAY